MRRSGIQFVIICLFIFSCKTTDMVKAKQSTDELYNANYKVTTLKDMDLGEEKPTIYVNAEENAISGNATCNDYRFEFKMDEKKMSMNMGISTKMYCDGKMEIERSFMSMMGNVKYISQTDEFLYLKDADNKLLIKAKKYKGS